MPDLRLIIDLDTGVDDAQALMLALGQTHLAEIVAVTCVTGNSIQSNVCRNTLRVLKEWGRLDVPVYRGCSGPLLGEPLWGEHHGEDGFGNLPDPSPPSLSLLQDEHAVNAMIRLAQENPGQLTLVALGPLTNVAMAIRLFPQLGQDLKQVYIMGGNIEGKGNITPSAEFNFGFDPEAAHVVLNEMTCPITLLPWETGLKCGNPWAFQDELSTFPSRKAQFYTEMTAFCDQRCKNRGDPRNIICDPLAMATALDSSVATETTLAYATVEISGRFTRGQVVVDWKGRFEKKPNVKIIHEVDMNKLQDMFRAVLRE